MNEHFDPAWEAAEIGPPPGHTLRPATWDDVAAVAALRAIANRRMHGFAGINEESVRHEWSESSFSLEADARLVHADDGALVGYYACYRAGQGNHPIFYGRIHPEAEGRGLGSAGLRWNVNRAMEMADLLPSGQRVSGFAKTPPGFAPAVALLEAFGMRPIRDHREMIIELDGREIPDPQWPGGIALRPFDPERETLALYRADDEAFQDHWGYEAPASEEEGLEEWRHWTLKDQRFDPTLFFVAWDGLEIAGLALCDPADVDDPAMGLVAKLAVRRPWRKSGLATALLHHSFAEFQRRGQARVCLEVDGENLTGAARLYERVGMRISHEVVTYELELRPGRETAAL